MPMETNMQYYVMAAYGLWAGVLLVFLAHQAYKWRKSERRAQAQIAAAKG